MIDGDTCGAHRAAEIRNLTPTKSLKPISFDTYLPTPNLVILGKSFFFFFKVNFYITRGVNLEIRVFYISFRISYN